MENLTDEQKQQRISLTLLFSFTTLIFLIATSVIVAIVLSTMVYHGQLQIGDVKLNLGKFILHLFLWSTVIGTVLTLLASRIPLKPVNKFLNVVNRLADGDYSVRLHYDGPLSQLPAVTEMTESINVLASELGQTELLRNDFINNFSHEFKTPIVSIAGFAKMLKRSDLTEEERIEYLDIIEEESLRLAQMANNVLDLTKVENQTILTNVQTFNLSEQIRTSVLLLERKWTKKNIEIILPDEEYEITGNMELLNLVWINVLENAVKFSPEFGQVKVNIRQNAKYTSVKVTNFSDDIPKEKLGKIFSKFYQADESHSTEGNGIGLAIVKKVTDLHHGTVQVKSENGETSFEIILPLR